MLWLILIAALVMFVLLVSGVLEKPADQRRAEAEANSEETFRELFDGSKTVSYKSHPGALPMDAVVEAADQRGYDVLDVEHGPLQIITLTFVRR